MSELKKVSAISRARRQFLAYAADALSSAAAASSTVLNESRPSPIGRTDPKPVSSAITGRPDAR